MPNPTACRDPAELRAAQSEGMELPGPRASTAVPPMKESGGLAVIETEVFGSSPSFFRDQIEGLASEYESLHAFSQALLAENRHLHSGAGNDVDEDLHAAGEAHLSSPRHWRVPRTSNFGSKPVIGGQSPRSPLQLSRQLSPFGGANATPRAASKLGASLTSCDWDVANELQEQINPYCSEDAQPRAQSKHSVTIPDRMSRQISPCSDVEFRPDARSWPSLTSRAEQRRTLTGRVSSVSQQSRKSVQSLSWAETETAVAGQSDDALVRQESPNASEGPRTHNGLVGSLYSQDRGSLAGGLFPKWFDPGNQPEHDNVSSLRDAFAELRVGSSWQFLSEDEPAEKCTISPVSRRRLSWDFCAFMLLLVELWMTPFELIFLEDCETPQAFATLSYIITGFFSVDIVLNFFTGFVEGDKTVMSRQRIFWHYVRLWFWIDLVATVPLELLLKAASGGALSVARLGKASKVVKTVRYLKLLRVARLVKISEQASKVTTHFKFFGSVRPLLVPLQVLFFLAVYAHIHGCVWAILQPEWVSVDNPEDGLELYFESFWWAYTAVTVGSVGSVGLREPRTYRWGIFLLEMMMASERLLLGVLCSIKILIYGLSFLDDARIQNARTDVLTYLRKNNVSFQTQIQVLFCLRDTSKASRQQRFSDSVNQEKLPSELHRTICAELWTDKLWSLGMIAEISDWHVDFITELAQLVSEEVHPSKFVLFKVGEAATVAYHIIEGEMIVSHTPGGRQVPNFKMGMWVGENALASSLLRRSATFQTVMVTSLMAVRSDSFHETMSRLGLMQRFQEFCSAQLWRGLCGRCGILGDHFSDSCRAAHRRPRVGSRLSGGKAHATGRQSHVDGFFGKEHSDSFEPRRSSCFLPRGSRVATNADVFEHQRNSGIRILSRELQRYLVETDLSWIGGILQEMEIYDLSDLEDLDSQMLRDYVPNLSAAQLQALSGAAIRKFQEQQARTVHRTLFHQVSRLQHLMFLSHYKLEAGTEAALLRTEIEQAIAKDPGSLGHRFEQPVFLDSDDLSNLEDLQERVRHTHNLVLLLTKGVLTRPWVLVEILTAWREGVRVQPVMITKPGSEFVFPDDAFYRRLISGGVLDAASMDCIDQNGFTLLQLELAIRNVFQQIAVPYSPHKATNIRQAEVEKLMKNCRLKSEGSRENGTSRTSNFRKMGQSHSAASVLPRDRTLDEGQMRQSSQSA